MKCKQNKTTAGKKTKPNPKAGKEGKKEQRASETKGEKSKMVD